MASRKGSIKGNSKSSRMGICFWEVVRVVLRVARW